MKASATVRQSGTALLVTNVVWDSGFTGIQGLCLAESKELVQWQGGYTCEPSGWHPKPMHHWLHGFIERLGLICHSKRPIGQYFNPDSDGQLLAMTNLPPVQ